MIDKNTPVKYEYCICWPEGNISLGEISLKEAIEQLNEQIFKTYWQRGDHTAHVEVLELNVIKGYLTRPAAIRISNPDLIYDWMFYNREFEQWESKSDPDIEYFSYIENLNNKSFEIDIEKIKEIDSK